MENAFVLPAGELRIPCHLTLPAGKFSRVVLGVHGFSGSSRDEIQENIAGEMALFSSAVVRFDFPAHGDSPRGEPLRLKHCQEALVAVAGWCREKFPQIRDLCIFATGFGAYVTLTVMPQLLDMPGRIRLVVQTPSVLMHETLLSMLGRSRETLWAMDRVTVPTPRPIDVTYRFYEELENNTVLVPQSIPMLILHGEKDDYIDMNDILSLRQANSMARLVLIPGATHRFQEEGAWDMVLDLTRDWFEFEQVTLCDWI